MVWVALFAALSLGFAGRAAYRYFAGELPDLTTVESYQARAPGVTRIYADDGTVLAELAREHRAYAPIEDIPAPLIAAFLSAEDRRFYTHSGLDYRGLARAMRANIRSGTVVQGGSTITQQVAKSFLADQERTLDRKIREAILALEMESKLGKDAILEIYLNKIFLGHGAYGVGAAASRYFDKSLDELTLAESAMIAGLAQAPSRWSPVANPDLALRRRNVVLADMVEAKAITHEEAEVASAETIELVELRDPFRWRAPFYAEHARRLVERDLGDDALLTDGLRIETAASLPIQRLAEANVDTATRRLDRRQGWRGAEAHLSSEAERAAMRERMVAEYAGRPFGQTERWVLALVTQVERRYAIVEAGVRSARLPVRQAIWAARYDRRSGVNGETIDRLDDALEVGDVIWVRPLVDREGERRFAEDSGDLLVELGQTPRVEATLYSFDHRSAYVEAMAAGRDYDRSQYNRATQACRSPGSVFKAFYYALALDQGWHMDDQLEAKAWEPEPGEVWNPRNIDKTLDGRVLLRTALIKSLNTPSIRLFLAVGIRETIAFARRLGFTTELIPDKGLSLGASCVRIDELSAAFGVFARGGSMRRPVYLRRIVDQRGELRLDQRDPLDAGLDVAGRVDRMAARVLEAPPLLVDPRTNFLISRLLREVVTAGTGTRASFIGAPAAGKSGTSSGRYYRNGRLDDLTTDAWFMGYTSRSVTAAWVGFDDRGERSLGDEEASYTTATPMWTRYMKARVELEAREHERIPGDPPSDIAKKVVDATTGGEPRAGMPTATVYFRRDLRNRPEPEFD